jgi:hypothetical protein
MDGVLVTPNVIEGRSVFGYSPLFDESFSSGFVR